jgi:hypothetical protein
LNFVDFSTPYPVVITCWVTRAWIFAYIIHWRSFIRLKRGQGGFFHIPRRRPLSSPRLSPRNDRDQSFASSRLCSMHIFPSGCQTWKMRSVGKPRFDYVQPSCCFGVALELDLPTETSSACAFHTHQRCFTLQSANEIQHKPLTSPQRWDADCVL